MIFFKNFETRVVLPSQGRGCAAPAVAMGCALRSAHAVPSSVLRDVPSATTAFAAAALLPPETPPAAALLLLLVILHLLINKLSMC